jgi:uncharacterized membrane protein
MTRVISYMFDDYQSARNAVTALQEAGFTSSDVSLVASNADKRYANDKTSSGAATGAEVGGAVGAGAGILTALGVLAIPGLGPLVAAGVLATTLTTTAVGAVAGGLIGSLTDYGISEADAHIYAEGIRRGGTLVTVRTADDRVAKAEAILKQFKPVDVRARRDYYTQSGWKAYDPKSPAYSADEIKNERSTF